MFNSIWQSRVDKPEVDAITIESDFDAAEIVELLRQIARSRCYPIKSFDDFAASFGGIDVLITLYGQQQVTRFETALHDAFPIASDQDLASKLASGFTHIHALAHSGPSGDTAEVRMVSGTGRTSHDKLFDEIDLPLEPVAPPSTATGIYPLRKKQG
jgi:hypothetical protein